LLNIDRAIFEELFKDQFPGKDKVVASNLKALDLGITYARENWKCPLDFHITPLNLNDGKILMDGNTACALGAVYGGATVMAWYPITPSTSVADAFEEYCSKLRIDKETGKHNYAIIQAEDELAAIGVVIGANWNGARAFTATSGPGVSLMNEFLGLAYFRRNTNSIDRCTACRTQYRYAYANTASRYHFCFLCLAWGYKASVVISLYSTRMF
jgi:2-oxoglutarate ferredoxin oxidoreductase subunit alpha